MWKKCVYNESTSLIKKNHIERTPNNINLPRNLYYGSLIGLVLFVNHMASFVNSQIYKETAKNRQMSARQCRFLLFWTLSDKLRNYSKSNSPPQFISKQSIFVKMHQLHSKPRWPKTSQTIYFNQKFCFSDWTRYSSTDWTRVVCGSEGSMIWERRRL